MNDEGRSADDVARSVVASGVAPDCAAACAIRRHVWRGEVGGSSDVLFDLASVTKPMTAVAIARARVDLRAPLVSLVPEARGTPSERVPLELFLSHRAGLDGHRLLYAPLLQGGAVDPALALHEAADARRLDAPGDPPAEGFAPLYSDLGYVLAGAALARATGACDAGEAIERLVLAPLGLSRAAGTVRGLAALGIVGPFAPTEDVHWRGGTVLGAVHDENAWALTGLGGSGHAGIFGTAGAVLAFGRAVLDSLDRAGGPFDDADLGWTVAGRAAGTLRAGFDGKSSEGSSAGGCMGEESFGHLGFTGTSLWVDPKEKVVVVLLTNRVSPSRGNVEIRAARPKAHDALFERAIFLSRS
jgi:CubicO group peptidase (beta-lactamase class C family)